MAKNHMDPVVLLFVLPPVGRQWHWSVIIHEKDKNSNEDDGAYNACTPSLIIEDNNNENDNNNDNNKD